VRLIRRRGENLTTLEVYEKSGHFGCSPAMVDAEQRGRRCVDKPQKGFPPAHHVCFLNAVARSFRSELEIGFQLVATSPALLLVGRNATTPFHPHVRHLEERGHEAVLAIEPTLTDRTEIEFGIREGATGAAKPFAALSLIETARRRLERHRLPLASLVVEEILRGKLADGKEPRPSDEISFLAPGNPGTDWECWEIVPR
jgi:hypothetical protein